MYRFLSSIKKLRRQNKKMLRKHFSREHVPTRQSCKLSCKSHRIVKTSPCCRGSMWYILALLTLLSVFWLYMDIWSQSLAVGPRPRLARPASGAPGGPGAIPARFKPFIDIDSVWIGFSSSILLFFLLLVLRQAMNIITATMTQTTIAVDAGMIILSSLLDPPTPSVRISRHCSNGTFDGVISTSSSDTTQTTIHS